jgi:hypothetical protein
LLFTFEKQLYVELVLSRALTIEAAALASVRAACAAVRTRCSAPRSGGSPEGIGIVDGDGGQPLTGWSASTSLLAPAVVERRLGKAMAAAQAFAEQAMQAEAREAAAMARVLTPVSAGGGVSSPISRPALDPFPPASAHTGRDERGDSGGGPDVSGPVGPMEAALAITDALTITVVLPFEGYAAAAADLRRRLLDGRPAACVARAAAVAAAGQARAEAAAGKWRRRSQEHLRLSRSSGVGVGDGGAGGGDRRSDAVDGGHARTVAKGESGSITGGGGGGGFESVVANMISGSRGGASPGASVTLQQAMAFAFSNSPTAGGTGGGGGAGGTVGNAGGVGGGSSPTPLLGAASTASAKSPAAPSSTLLAALFQPRSSPSPSLSPTGSSSSPAAVGALLRKHSLVLGRELPSGNPRAASVGGAGRDSKGRVGSAWVGDCDGGRRNNDAVGAVGAVGAVRGERGGMVDLESVAERAALAVGGDPFVEVRAVNGWAEPVVLGAEGARCGLGVRLEVTLAGEVKTKQNKTRARTFART